MFLHVIIIFLILHYRREISSSTSHEYRLEKYECFFLPWAPSVFCCANVMVCLPFYFKLAEGDLTETMSFACAQRYEFGRAKRGEFVAQM